MLALVLLTPTVGSPLPTAGALRPGYKQEGCRGCTKAPHWWQTKLCHRESRVARDSRNYSKGEDVRLGRWSKRLGEVRVAHMQGLTAPVAIFPCDISLMDGF